MTPYNRICYHSCRPAGFTAVFLCLLALAVLPLISVAQTVQPARESGQVNRSGNSATMAPWRLHKDKDGVQIYFRESPGSRIKELKISIVVPATLNTVLYVLNNAEKFNEWVYGSLKAYTMPVKGEELVYYNLLDFPWPMKDREFIMRTETRQDPKSLVVTSTSYAAPKLLPENKEHIRVQETDIDWKFTPLRYGLTRIDYQLRTDPGGSIPAWAINMALDVGPTKTLRKFKELVASETYRHVKVEGIREPAP